MKVTHKGILIKTLKEGHCSEDTNVDDRMILKWVYNVMGRLWTPIHMAQKCGRAVGSYEHVSGPFRIHTMDEI